mgnify:CR=1 FL=1
MEFRIIDRPDLLEHSRRLIEALRLDWIVNVQFLGDHLGDGRTQPLPAVDLAVIGNHRAVRIDAHQVGGRRRLTGGHVEAEVADVGAPGADRRRPRLAEAGRQTLR